MRNPIKHIATVLALASAVVCQQPNLPTASLTVNGRDGAPYPVRNVVVRPGEPALVQAGGVPGELFAIATSRTLRDPGLQTDWGTLHWDPATFGYLLFGEQLGPDGRWQRVMAVPPTAVPGERIVLQAIMSVPGAPGGGQVSAATEIVVGAATDQIVIPLADDDAFYLDLGAVGVPFYGQTYHGLHVGSNGFVTFGAPDHDFTPTSAEMINGPPRIAACWTDLDPSAGGTITATIDRNVSPPSITLSYEKISGFGSASAHWFDILIWSEVGDVEISFPSTSAVPTLPALVGIAPGGSRGAALPRDLSSSVPHASLPYEALFESFGDPKMPRWPDPHANAWDLNGRTIRFENTHLSALATWFVQSW